MVSMFVFFFKRWDVKWMIEVGGWRGMEIRVRV